MANSGGGSHIGSALSIADILSVLYSDILNIDSKDPNLETRDRFSQIPYFRYIWICVVSKDINYDGAIKVQYNFIGFLSGFKTFQHIADFGLTGTASKTCR